MRRLSIVALLLVAGCTSPADKIATKLEDAGVPHRQSRCMGDRLAERLSYGQLKTLSSLAKPEDGQRMSVNKLARRLGDADPQLVSELIQAGISCAI